MSEHDILQLAIYTVSGFLVGLFLHKIVMPLIARLASKTSIRSDDLIIETIRKWVIPWFLALGLFLGLKQLELESRVYFWIENGLMIFYILSATLIIARVVSGMIKIKAAGSDAVIPSSSIISNIVIIIIYCIGLLIILQSQGISITPVLTALGVGGLAVALALQPTLSNLFAGLQIISSGNFNRGNFIKLASGEDGYIEDITWRSTTIRAMSDHLIIVPNSKLADMIVTNYNLPVEEISFLVEVGISYDSDIDHVEKVTKEVIKETLMEAESGVKDFEPVIRFFAFGESSIRIKAVLRVNNYDAQFAVKSEFIKKLLARYNQEGITIPFPTRTVLKKEND
ncbi:MAG TPA: mechanosensitive ion channel domain-containing protein [Ferruginibacter sp.]|nr:mechanosensitive ion channel domain-containing protein [Ferruginibacter sp.]